VWGNGDQAAARKANNTPILDKPITAELGGVGPCIVVPGDWSDVDIRFQAEHVATTKLINCGHNCNATQFWSSRRIGHWPTSWSPRLARSYAKPSPAPRTTYARRKRPTGRTISRY
jgi:hypothetical protein